MDPPGKKMAASHSLARANRGLIRPRYTPTDIAEVPHWQGSCKKPLTLGQIDKRLATLLKDRRRIASLLGIRVGTRKGVAVARGDGASPRPALHHLLRRFFHNGGLWRMRGGLAHFLHASPAHLGAHPAQLVNVALNCRSNSAVTLNYLTDLHATRFSSWSRRHHAN